MNWLTPGSSTPAPTRGRTVPVARERTDVPPDRLASAGLGQVPLLALLASFGLLACAVADALSRATLAPPSIIYWAGLLIITLPIFYRLCSSQPSTRERLVLVCLLGMALYCVKLARDPFVFTFPDELVHAFNANQIADQHRLFDHNSLLPVTARYPGLEGATSSLMTLTGMSSYGAGILVIGAARLVLMIGLFLLFCRVSGSPRVAGLATAIYAANTNFLLWSVQFSYQSLALPLFVLVVAALAERDTAAPAQARRWEIPIVLGIAALVITHHVTSYLLLATILALMLARRIAQRSESMPPLGHLAAISGAAAVVWLAAVAPSAVDYLWSPLSEAASSTFETLTGQHSLRQLFSPESSAHTAGVTSAPKGARAITFLYVVVLLAALPVGVRYVWRRYRAQPFALVFCVAGIGFFGALGLRFVAAAWETGNRASEFLFIGLAFVTAFAALFAISRISSRKPGSPPWLGRGVVTGVFGLVFVGGAIAGWPWDAQLTEPVRADFDGRTVESEPLGLSRWVAEHLPEGRFAASLPDARFLLAPGGVYAIAGKHPDVQDVLTTEVIQAFQLPLLRRFRLRYVVADRRPASVDLVRGYSFDVSPGLEPRPQAIVTKFEQLPETARVFHSGQIAVLDLEARK